MKTLLKLAVTAALCLPAGAQTVAIPGMLVTIPARAVPSQTFTIDVPKNGGKMSITIPSQILPPQVTSTAPRTAPVSLATATWNFTCTAPINADGTPDLKNLSCQTAQQVAQVRPALFEPREKGICDFIDCGYTDHVLQPVITRQTEKAAVPNGDGIQDIGTLGKLGDCKDPGVNEGCETHRRAAIYEAKKEKVKQ